MKRRHDVNVEEIFLKKRLFHEREASLPFVKKMAISLGMQAVADGFKKARKSGELFIKTGLKTGPTVKEEP